MALDVALYIAFETGREVLLDMAFDVALETGLKMMCWMVLRLLWDVGDMHCDVFFEVFLMWVLKLSVGWPLHCPSRCPARWSFAWWL